MTAQQTAITLKAGLSASEVQKLGEAFEPLPAQEVLAWALGRFGDRVSLASSFGAEDMVLTDMLVKLSPKARIFTLDTLRLNKETLELLDETRDRYGVNLEVFYPETKAANDMVARHGLNLMYESVDNRKLCCGIRKVEPLNRALKDLVAWTTGLRREQAPTRAAVAKVEADEAHPGLIKLNPLADWTNDQVWDYIRANKVPYNKLHDKGYPSIGCDPCTRAVKAGEHPRAGRWWWEQDLGLKECGLHVAGAPAGAHAKG
ncbi:MAG: phosphoadenylyl-sulfate reductase [Chloroflexi bacterium]|nr:phosphoadenylyl-sulfate reductase [Chloroflexota bacterium]